MIWLKNTVINFHAVYDKEWMEKILIFLKKNYNIITLGDLYQFYTQDTPLKNSCHITFDDGDASFFNIVFPLLQKHKIPVSIYVSPKIIKEQTNFWFQEIRNYDKRILKDIYCELKVCSPNTAQKPLHALLKNSNIDFIWQCIKLYRKRTNTEIVPCMNMDTSQVQELQSSGLVEIGAHTMNHPILRNETDEKSYKEISTSIDELSKILNKKIEYFAYPNGIPDIDFNAREMNTLKSAGIKMAFSTEARSFQEGDNLFKIPRNGISKGSIPFIFIKLLLGTKYKKIKRILKGKQENEYRAKF